MSFLMAVMVAMFNCLKTSLKKNHYYQIILKTELTVIGFPFSLAKGFVKWSYRIYCNTTFSKYELMSLKGTRVY